MKDTFRISKAYSIQSYPNKYMFIDNPIIRPIPVEKAYLIFLSVNKMNNQVFASIGIENSRKKERIKNSVSTVRRDLYMCLVCVLLMPIK
jgi:hypothetical protein